MLRVISFLLFAAAHLAADPGQFNVDRTGSWSLPLRYWAHFTPYESAGSYAFLTEVTELGPEVPPISQQEPPLRFRTGKMKVVELLYPKGDKAHERLSRVRVLSVEGANGLKIGDRVVVFVDPEQYEGGYVINYHEGGCLLGIRLPPANDLDFGEEAQKEILKSIREERTQLRKLTFEELSAWIAVDPVGIARNFQRELEMEHLQWTQHPK